MATHVARKENKLHILTKIKICYTVTIEVYKDTLNNICLFQQL